MLLFIKYKLVEANNDTIKIIKLLLIIIRLFLMIFSKNNKEKNRNTIAKDSNLIKDPIKATNIPRKKYPLILS